MCIQLGSFCRYKPDTFVKNIDHSTITWLLTSICAVQCIKNPYVVAKLIEVMFVVSPSITTNMTVFNAVRLSASLSTLTK